MLEENELEVLKLYPSSKICDEWKQCVYEADIESRDLHCEDCATYWELVELEKTNKDAVGFVLTTSVVFNKNDNRDFKNIVVDIEDKILDLIESMGHTVIVGNGKPILKSELK